MRDAYAPTTTVASACARNCTRIVDGCGTYSTVVGRNTTTERAAAAFRHLAQAILWNVNRERLTRRSAHALRFELLLKEPVCGLTAASISGQTTDPSLPPPGEFLHFLQQVFGGVRKPFAAHVGPKHNKEECRRQSPASNATNISSASTDSRTQ